MVRSAPKFWSQTSRSWHSYALSLPAFLYATGARMRGAMANPCHFDRPVLCVGNLVMGGGGKTPIVMGLAHSARAHGLHIAITSKGYGGGLKGPLLVDPSLHIAPEVGDESLIESRIAPCFISKNRKAGVHFAFQQGYDVVIMDDGFQNPTLAPHASLLVIDGAFGLGNGALFPAGPLRESPQAAFARADAVIMIGCDDHDLRKYIRYEIPVIQAWPETVLPNGIRLDQPVIAFTGIARPEKFFRGLRQAGLHIMDTHAFPDHYQYQDHDIDRLLSCAVRDKTKLITTEKDAVRFSDAQRDRFGDFLVIAEYKVNLEDPWSYQRLVDQFLRIPAHHPD